jgi:hypothetical protein
VNLVVFQRRAEASDTAWQICSPLIALSKIRPGLDQGLGREQRQSASCNSVDVGIRVIPRYRC